MSGFLDRWKGKSYQKDWRTLSRRTIKTDRWDEEDLNSVLEMMKDFRTARDELCDTVETGNAATADTFFSFFKNDPHNIDSDKVRPDYRVNEAVRDELQSMTEYEELRSCGTVGDDVNSALAFVTMEESLETIFDKLKAEQELAKKLQEQMDELNQLMDEEQSIDDMIKDMQDDDPALSDAEKQKAKNQKDQAKAEANAQDLAEKLEKGLDGKQQAIQKELRKGLNEAKDEAQAMEQMEQTWGTDPGEASRLPAEKRLELAKRIKDQPKLKRLAELIGPMKRVAFGEQRKKVDHAREEVHDVEKGDDLAHLLPEELMTLHHPKLKRLFYRNLAERELLQYELKGEDKVGLGGIICEIDSSGSMSGNPEIWAKAVGISLLHVAKQQKRSFLGVHFGSAHEIAEYVFEKPEDYTSEKIFDFAEFFFGGGTDFQVPLTRAVKHLREEYDKSKKVKGDIVFITDGTCSVSDSWLEDFKREQEDLGFQVFGVVIGGGGYYNNNDVLEKICDGKVVTIKSLTSPDDVRDIFGRLHS